MMIRLNSMPLTTKKPIVMMTSCTVAMIAPTRELPFEAEPDIDQHERRATTMTPIVPCLASSLETVGPTVSTRRNS